ncbi:MAG: hypothetical protein EOP06_13275 [Proteobacteria bacterium]|nr:MAG: hypothetical protein EOP06_13275 [Pseudomonadota bacterium]
MKDDLQRLELLRVGQGLGMRFGATIVRSPRQQGENLSYETIALELLSQFLPMCALRSLWCDVEIQGDRAKVFETEVKRCNREIYPGDHLKVRVRDSKTIHLIQLADVMAYALRTQARNALESPELVQFLKEIVADEKNLILYR